MFGSFSVVTNHQDMAGKHRCDKQKDGYVTAQPQHWGEKQKQKWNTTSNNHPKGMLAHFHVIWLVVGK